MRKLVLIALAGGALLAPAAAHARIYDSESECTRAGGRVHVKERDGTKWCLAADPLQPFDSGPVIAGKKAGGGPPPSATKPPGVNPDATASAPGSSSSAGKNGTTLPAVQPVREPGRRTRNRKSGKEPSK